MSLEYIQGQYKVPARRGVRVRYTGDETPKEGTIIGAEGPHLLVRFDGKRIAVPLHPTWKIEYLDSNSGGAA